ncbi:MAG: hypothetical protein QNJ35_17205, partial [Paracoccaceae bacterium]|nr:hypothetical protein [Paracoccaceae bacterium]
MRPGTFVLLGISAFLLLAGFQVSIGVFTMDESVYFLGADVFRTTGGFILDNGFDRFGSTDLTWTGFLRVGPNGMTTQYPPGMSVIGGGVVALFGVRGLIFLNIAATVGSLFVTRALALELFGRERQAMMASLLLLAGTFVVEYAYGYWPHMVSVLAVNLSFLLFWRALTHDTRRIGHALASGLVLGLGMHFRLECALLLPLIGLVTLHFAERWRHMVEIAIGGSAGLFVPLLTQSVINHGRYGTWNPLSYGSAAGGGTSLTTYLLPIGLILLLAGGLIAVRLIGNRARPGIWGLLLLSAFGIALAILPQMQSLALNYAKGVLGLVVDATQIVDTRPGVRVDEETGLLSFWGLAKKALGQSLPWIGILLALIGLRWRDDRRSISVLLILIAVWSFPFLVRSWHGGLGSNMRYFLPVLPALCILATWTIAQLMHDVKQAERLLQGGGLAGLALAAAWAAMAPTGLAGAHQILSTWVFLAVAGAGLLAGFFAAGTIRRIALAIAAIGVGVGAFNGITDTGVAQMRRENVVDLADSSKGVDGPALVYFFLYRSVSLAPDQYSALSAGVHPDAVMIDQVLEEGMRVIMPDFV